MNDVVLKICKGCEQSKPIFDFYKNRTSRLNYCKICCYEKESAYRITAEGSRSKRASTLLRKYKLSYEGYLKMLAGQHNECLICNSSIKEKGSKSEIAHVDHNHLTGKVRGLLCGYCNSVLGVYKEDTNIFQKAINYLKEHDEE